MSPRCNQGQDLNPSLTSALDVIAYALIGSDFGIISLVLDLGPPRRAVSRTWFDFLSLCSFAYTDVMTPTRDFAT